MSDETRTRTKPTVGVRLLAVDVEIGRLVFPERHERPKTRGECVDGLRPCPYVGCRYNLAIEVTRAGSIKLKTPSGEPDRHPSCALDVADEGPATPKIIAAVFGVTEQRVYQLVDEALASVGAQPFAGHE